MSSPFRTITGQDFDDLFDPDVIGDGYTATFLRRADGTPLRYASASYGSVRADVGARDATGVDVARRWAAKGTAVYALPINGGTYSANNQTRGGAYVRFQIFANGTYQVLRAQQTTTTWEVVASGTWLPAGDSAANWSVVYEAVEQGRSLIGDTAKSGVENQAPGVTAVTSNPYCSGWCSAIYTNTNATSNGYLRIYLYRAGALRSTTTISYWCNVNGN